MKLGHGDADMVAVLHALEARTAGTRPDRGPVQPWFAPRGMPYARSTRSRTTRRRSRTIAAR